MRWFGWRLTISRERTMNVEFCEIFMQNRVFQISILKFWHFSIFLILQKMFFFNLLLSTETDKDHKNQRTEVEIWAILIQNHVFFQYCKFCRVLIFTKVVGGESSNWMGTWRRFAVWMTLCFGGGDDMIGSWKIEKTMLKRQN